LNKSEFSSLKHVSYHVWFKLTKWFLRRSRLNKGSGELKLHVPFPFGDAISSPLLKL